MTQDVDRKRLRIPAELIKLDARLAGISTRTIARWHLRGARGIKLNGQRVGGRVLYSLADVDKFLELLNAPAEATPAPRSPHERSKASERAAQELAAAGL